MKSGEEIFSYFLFNYLRIHLFIYLFLELRMRSCVLGYHGYQRVWEAVVGENLECERETRNVKDRNAVVAKKAEKTIRCN